MELINGDCLEVMKDMPDKSVDAVITDPPYGINLQTNYKSRGRGRLTGANDYSPIAGDNEKFNISPFLRFPLVVAFGANYYDVSGGSWHVWDKLDGLTSTREVGFCDNSDCEFIWASKPGANRIFRHRWMGMLKGSEHDQRRVHPTQKPIALMGLIIRYFTNEGDTIFDPFMGSGTTGVACVQTGRNFIGVEINPDYFAIAEQRIKKAQMQPRLL